MGYQCSLFVANINQFTGVYSDAATAASDIISRASAYATFDMSVNELADYIEAGGERMTVDLRLRQPQVHVEIRQTD